MKLSFSGASPYVRKAMACAIIRGIDGQISDLGLKTADAALAALNPLAKIPTFVTPDGLALYDSPVICEYLDSLAAAPRLLPEGVARWGVLRRQALADGVMDAAFNLVMERRRPEAQRSTEWTTRWTHAIAHAIATLEAELPGEAPPFDLGWIATLAATDYVEFRLADLGMAATAPKLTAWRATMATRASVAQSAPPRS